jgi:hypothetical protein
MCGAKQNSGTTSGQVPRHVSDTCLIGTNRNTSNVGLISPETNKHANMAIIQGLLEK